MAKKIDKRMFFGSDSNTCSKIKDKIHGRRAFLINMYSDAFYTNDEVYVENFDLSICMIYGINKRYHRFHDEIFIDEGKQNDMRYKSRTVVIDSFSASSVSIEMLNEIQEMFESIDE